jgi:chloramphenicol 3-O phosphotransferase
MMSATLIVLNGPSSVGKSTIVSSLQDLWPRPLFASGLDVFIRGWPDSHVTLPGDDGSPATESGMRIVAGAGPAPSWIPEYGDEFHKIMKFAHESWAAMSSAGIDVVVDHVILDATLREQARSSLTNAFWVGVTCDIDVLIRRETDRGDRRLGFASGTAHVVHNEMTYDLMVDTTVTSADVVARQIYDTVCGSANARRSTPA